MPIRLLTTIAISMALAVQLGSPLAAGQDRATKPLPAIVVECQSCGLDIERIRRAVQAELESSKQGSVQEASGALRLRIQGKMLSALYETPEGRTLRRQMALPPDPGRAMQTIALLCANLIRNEAADLIEQLQREHQAQADAQSIETEVEPPSTPSTTESAAPEATSSTAPINERPVSRTGSGYAGAKSNPMPSALPMSAFNASLWHPLALYPSSNIRTFRGEFGIVYSRVGAIAGGLWSFGAAVVDQRMDGVAVAGVGTWSKGPVRGLMFALGGNRSQGASRGLQVASLVNLAGEQSWGGQIGGINVVEDGFDGAQLGLINIATGEMRGAQVGLINVARRVSGTQVGAANIAGEVEGFPVGPLNINKTGRMQALVWSATTMPVNGGIRYLHRYAYTLLAAGWRPAESQFGGDGVSRVAWQAAIGGHLPVKVWYFDLDAGYAHEGAAGQGTGVSHTQVLRFRLTAGWQATRAVGVFVGGATRSEFSDRGEVRHRPEAFGGIQFN